MAERTGEGGAAVPELTGREQKEVEERSGPRTEVIYEAVREEGESELKRSSVTLAWDGLTAGLSMGFSMVAEGLLRAHLPDAPWRPAVSKLGYSVGFLIVILGSQQLFTENTLTAVLPLLQRFNLKTLGNVLRLWAVVLVANLVGAFVFAWVAGHTELFRPEVRAAFTEIGREALEGGAATVFLRGLYAGWLIATMVWMLPASESARFFVVVVMTYLVAFAGLAHIVAGGVEVFYVVLRGEAAWADFFRWVAPTLLGNIVGGSTLVAALGHAQVAGETGKKI
ncbi:MAG TPA: formate/nitrite transporter family protein [Pyrinomonadaceae bacterium]|jgi:formate/nitrite transporter FocA (FNT family)|nr:formate/nitrite transporter family protein [Pyrinomonadaceae bacterium]